MNGGDRMKMGLGLLAVDRVALLQTHHASTTRLPDRTPVLSGTMRGLKKRPGWISQPGRFRITGRVKSPKKEILEVDPELGVAPVLISRAKTILL